jgi:hypothetical protein
MTAPSSSLPLAEPHFGAWASMQLGSPLAAPRFADGSRVSSAERPQRT